MVLCSWLAGRARYNSPRPLNSRSQRPNISQALWIRENCICAGGIRKPQAVASSHKMLAFSKLEWTPINPSLYMALGPSTYWIRQAWHVDSGTKSRRTVTAKSTSEVKCYLGKVMVYKERKRCFGKLWLMLTAQCSLESLLSFWNPGLLHAKLLRRICPRRARGRRVCSELNISLFLHHTKCIS